MKPTNMYYQCCFMAAYRRMWSHPTMVLVENHASSSLAVFPYWTHWCSLRIFNFGCPQTSFISIPPILQEAVDLVCHPPVTPQTWHHCISWEVSCIYLLVQCLGSGCHSHSTLKFTEHISNLLCSCYFHPRWLRAVGWSVSSPVSQPSFMPLCTCLLHLSAYRPS